MNLFVYRASSVATGALAILTLASCDGSQLASVNSDRIVPSVSTEITNSTSTSGIDSVSVRAPLQVKVSAQDNAALLAVTTRVFADEGLVKTDSVSFPVASTDFSKTLSISLAGVTSGQVVRVVTRAVDGTGNVAVDTVAAVAFDPNVPKLSFSRAASADFTSTTPA